MSTADDFRMVRDAVKELRRGIMSIEAAHLLLRDLPAGVACSDLTENGRESAPHLTGLAVENLEAAIDAAQGWLDEQPRRGRR